MRAGARLAILALPLAMTGCGAKSQPGVKVDPALALMVPETATALAGVKLDAMRATAAYRHLQNLPELGEFSRTTGLDLKTAVWELLIVTEPSDTVTLARGKFSPGFGGLEPRVLPGAPRTRYKSYTIIGDEVEATVFVNSTTAITGAGPAVRSILDRRAASRGIPPALAGAMRNMPAGAGIWAASAGRIPPLPIPPETNLANLNRILGSFDSGWVAFTLGDTVEVAARGVCPTRRDAWLLREALRALIGLARLTAPRGRAAIAWAYNSVQIAAHDRDVDLSANLPLEVVDGLISMIR